MYFEQESINKKLQCPICNERLKDPVLLPCEEYVCQECIDDFIAKRTETNQTTTQFKCLLCDQEHVIPENGFQKSKLVNSLLELKPKKVNRAAAVERFSQDINKCAEKMNQIVYSLKNKEKVLKEKFDSRRHKIQAEAEGKIDALKKRAREQLDHLDELEKERLASLRDQTQQSALEASFNKLYEEWRVWLESTRLSEITEDDATLERQKLGFIKKGIKIVRSKINEQIFGSNDDQDDDNDDDADASELIDELEIDGIKLGGHSSFSRRLSKIAHKFRADGHLLLDLNVFDDGILCATDINHYYCSNRVHADQPGRYLFFTLLDPLGNKIRSFSSRFSFGKENMADGSIRSLSNGTHILISINCADAGKQYLFLVSQHSLHETHICDFEKILAFDSYGISVLSGKAREEYMIDFDLTLRIERESKLDRLKSLLYRFDQSASMMINGDFLYVHSKVKVEIFNLSSKKLVSAFRVNLQETPISYCFLKDHFVIRYRDHLQCIDLRKRKEFREVFNHPEMSDDDLVMKPFGQDKLLFFNIQKRKFYATSEIKAKTF